MIPKLANLRTRRAEDGFTMIELLVVVIIIAILAAIAIPVYILMQRGAVDSTVKSDVKQTALEVARWRVNSGDAAGDNNANVAFANTNEYKAAGGKLQASPDVVIGLKGTADGNFTVCGFSKKSLTMQTPESSWYYTSQGAKFGTTTDAGSGKCDGAVDADGNDLSFTGIAPKLTTTSLPNGKVGTDYTYQLTASGNPAPKFSGSGVPGLVVAENGQVTGKPTTAGDATLTVVVTNGTGSDTQALPITIASAGIAPKITTAANALPAGWTGVDYTYQLEATGTPTPTWSGSVNGLTINSDGSITGKPTNTGTFTLSARATNSAGSDTRDFTISVTANNVAPVITTTTFASPLRGVKYSQFVVATGPAHITYAVASGALPTGTTLNTATGEVSGIPSDTALVAYNFQIKATNADYPSLSATKQYSAVKNHLPPLYNPKTLSITRSAGMNYFNAVANSGEATLKYALVVDSYPTGASTNVLTINTSTSDFSGNLTVAGVYSLHVTATNSYGSDSKYFTINVGGSAVTGALDFEDANWQGKTVNGLTVSYSASPSYSSYITSLNRSTGKAHGGTYALFAATNGNNYSDGKITITITGATVGRKYSLSGYYSLAANSNNTGSSYYYSNEYGSSTGLSSICPVAGNGGTNTAWGTLGTATCTATSTTITYTMVLYQNLGPYTGQGVYLDDLAVTEYQN